MKHFRNIGAIELTPLLNAVKRHADRFKDQTWRQDYPGSAHMDSETIYLRMPPVVSVESIFNSLEATDLDLMDDHAFSNALFELSCITHAPIARAMLVNLKAGGTVAPHIDQGVYAEATERYHLPILTNPDVLMSSGGETVHMAAGEVWWFDKHSMHCVSNGGSDRIHLIVDTFR